MKRRTCWKEVILKAGGRSRKVERGRYFVTYFFLTSCIKSPWNFSHLTICSGNINYVLELFQHNESNPSWCLVDVLGNMKQPYTLWHFDNKNRISASFHPSFCLRNRERHGAYLQFVGWSCGDHLHQSTTWFSSCCRGAVLSVGLKQMGLIIPKDPDVSQERDNPIGDGIRTINPTKIGRGLDS